MWFLLQCNRIIFVTLGFICMNIYISEALIRRSPPTDDLQFKTNTSTSGLHNSQSHSTKFNTGFGPEDETHLKTRKKFTKRTGYTRKTMLKNGTQSRKINLTTYPTTITTERKTTEPTTTNPPGGIKDIMDSNSVEEPITLIPVPRIQPTMRAAVLEEFGEPEVIQIKTVSTPKIKMTEVLVEVRAAGLNVIDAEQRRGFTTKRPELPAILGKEAAGIVVRAGNMTDFSIGERVLCCFTSTGAYSEYVSCDMNYVVRIPERISFAQASTVYVSYFTAYRALVQKAKVKKGEIVYIHGGTGGFGIAALQIAKHLGCTVVSTHGRNERGRDLLLKQGADHVHCHRDTGHTIVGLRALNYSGYDVILETIAETNLAEDVFSLRLNGRIVVVGSHNDVGFNPISLIIEESNIYGVMLSKQPVIDFYQASLFIQEGMKDGWINPYIEETFNFEKVVDAHIELESRPFSIGKLVLEFDGFL